MYGADHPRCACGDFALDGKATCGRVACLSVRRARSFRGVLPGPARAGFDAAMDLLEDTMIMRAHAVRWLQAVSDELPRDPDSWRNAMYTRNRFGNLAKALGLLTTEIPPGPMPWMP